MVLVVLAIHPLLNYFIGAVCFTASGVTSFKATKSILQAQDKQNTLGKNYKEITNNYQSVTFHREIIIDNDNNESKIKFHEVVRFNKIPNKEDLANNKDQLWYNGEDYKRFRNEEIDRKKKEFNLQEMMRKQEEEKHLKKLLHKMQTKEEKRRNRQNCD